MESSTAAIEKPGLFNAIVIMTLVSGIVNFFWGIAASAAALATFIGILCIPLTALPIVLGIFEILFAARLLATPPQPVQPSPAIAVLEIACVLAGNVFSMFVGILALVFYHDEAVEHYFLRLNGMPDRTLPSPPLPPPPAVPAPLPPERSGPGPREVA